MGVPESCYNRKIKLKEGKKSEKEECLDMDHISRHLTDFCPYPSDRSSL